MLSPFDAVVEGFGELCVVFYYHPVIGLLQKTAKVIGQNFRTE